MLVSLKCQYALRAILDLACRYDEGKPVKIAETAKAQAIPARFLEVILSQLKQGGFVASQRGNVGGYYLVRAPKDISVGDVIRFVQGPLAPVECVRKGRSKSKCPLHAGCVLLPMWDRVQKAMSDVYDTTTFQDLVGQERKKAKDYVPGYAI